MISKDPRPDSKIDSSEVGGSTRRSLLRSAVFYAMFAGSGVSLSACGGGGSDSGGNSSPPESAGSVFKHGVASGDPLPDRVIVWTRVTAPAPGALNVDWEIASDEAFGIVIARGIASTGPDRDYTIKIDVTGLQAASVYFYRFATGADRSPVGRTKTLPVGGVAQAKFAVVSCANFPGGYFNVYADIAKRADLDLVLHLGDYIYEYGRLGYASQLAFALDRVSAPDH